MDRYSQTGQALIEVIFLLIVFALIFVAIEATPLLAEKEMSRYEFAQRR